MDSKTDRAIAVSIQPELKSLMGSGSIIAIFTHLLVDT